MDKEFDKSVGEERDRFVIAVREQEWDTKLRTAAENILVMYDQMREKLASPSLREQPLRDALEAIHKLFMDDYSNEITLSRTLRIVTDALAARTALEGDGLTEQEIKNIEAMADEICRLANIERRLIKEAAILIDRYRMAAPAKDLGFTKARCEKWMIEYNELQPHLNSSI